MRKNILVCAYAISPIRGSEYSVAWNYINEMSVDNNLFILYGCSGDHMGDFGELENWLLNRSIPNVEFVQVKPNQLARLLNYLNRIGLVPYVFYLAYNIWHRQVYKMAKCIVKNVQIDLVHFLNPIGYREPGYLWKLNLPYIWGPIGGVPNRPQHLFNDLKLKNKIFFVVRNWVNTIQFKYNKRIKTALNRTDLLLTATTENQELIDRVHSIKSIYIPENAIIESNFTKRIITSNYGKICEIVWVGSIDSRKSLSFLIGALGDIIHQNWHLNIVGDGPLINDMKTLAEKNQISKKITWHGKLKRSEVFEVLNMSHLHIITSLGEGNPTALWEAMDRGIPTISLNHCGMKDIICENCGVKIAIDSVDQIKKDLALAISNLLVNPSKINLLSQGVFKCSRNYTWNNRRELFKEYYDLAIDVWSKKRMNNQTNK